MTKEKNSQMQTAAPDPKADQKQAGASSKADAADEGTLAQLQNDVAHMLIAAAVIAGIYYFLFLLQKR